MKQNHLPVVRKKDKRKTKTLRTGRNYKKYYKQKKKKKKEEITKHTRFLSTFKVDVQVDDGGDDDANAGDEEDVDDFVDTDSNWAVAVASASNDDDDIEEDGDGDSESKDNGNDDDDSKWSVFWDKSKMSKQHWT